MSDLKQTQPVGKTIHALLRIDSSIRNGQFVYANRQACKLMSDLGRGDHDVSADVIPQLIRSLKRTILFLKPVVESYSQNQASINLIRRASTCQNKQPNQ